MVRWALLPWALLAWGQDAGAPVALPGATLTVEISGFESLNGNLLFALHDHEGKFPGEKEAIKTGSVKVTVNPMVLTFPDLKPGTYAVSVVHDENANGKMDTKIFGIPAEPVGVSNNPKSRMGPPLFDESKFSVAKDPLKIAIKLVK